MGVSRLLSAAPAVPLAVGDLTLVRCRQIWSVVSSCRNRLCQVRIIVGMTSVADLLYMTSHSVLCITPNAEITFAVGSKLIIC